MTVTGELIAEAGSRTVVIDADVHNAVPSIDALLPYLSSYWQEEIHNTAFGGAGVQPYPLSPEWAREGAVIGASGVPGGDPAELVAQAFDGAGADYVILNCAYAVDSIHNPDASAALASAVNDWQVTEWLERDRRLRASIVVPVHDPEAAAAEIRRMAGHPGFVQVALPARSRELYGQRRYLPMLSAAASEGLAVSIQYGGFSGNAPTSVGWPTYHVEEDVGMASIVQSQLLSLVSEGTWERIPDLRVVVVDGGFTWLPSFLWRLDKDWKGIRREVPWVRRAPSEYVHEHVRFTMSPVDAPTDQPEVVADLLGQMWGDELLLYGSDFPRWRYEAHERALLDVLAPEGRQKVMGTNAAEWYGVERFGGK
ncbi:MAG TPA: amidohydrolase family protein [Acidimicrobiales bacterium]|nr:amidohydrolase family protein [Acidimicrobiales bacterium]